jgi:serine protease Do
MTKKMRFFVFLLVGVNLVLVLIGLSLLLSRTGSATAEAFGAAPLATSDSERSVFGRQGPVVQAAAKVSPAVVGIGAVKYVREIRPGFDEFFSPFIIYPYSKQLLPFLGSGFLINSNGYVMTNYHVIEGAEKIIVTLVDGREFDAKLLDADTVVDVALLKIEGKDFPSAKLGSSDDLVIGEWVIAIGNPFGNLIEDPRPTVTIGVVSALNRSFLPESDRVRAYQNMIQTDAAINPGNSGGPLVNINGEVVGINTFIVSRSGGSVGLGFAIPINRARAVAKEIIEHGKIRALWLDFECITVTPYIAKALDLKTQVGALVRSMEKDGPASKAGLQVGDVILQANNSKIRDSREFSALFYSLQVGEKVEFIISRGDKTFKVTYTVQEAPKQPR